MSFQRELVLRRPTLPRHKQEPEHGTRSGYDWHRRDMNEPACPECREAERVYWVNERIRRRETILSNAKRRRTENPLRYISRRGRARKLGLEYGYYTDQDVINTYGTDCHICGKAIDFNAPRQTGRPGWENGLQIDHVHPMAKGGEDKLDNVRPAHGYCNNVKNDSLDYSHKFQKSIDNS